MPAEKPYDESCDYHTLPGECFGDVLKDTKGIHLLRRGWRDGEELFHYRVDVLWWHIAPLVIPGTVAEQFKHLPKVTRPRAEHRWSSRIHCQVSWPWSSSIQSRLYSATSGVLQLLNSSKKTASEYNAEYWVQLSAHSLAGLSVKVNVLLRSRHVIQILVMSLAYYASLSSKIISRKNTFSKLEHVFTWSCQPVDQSPEFYWNLQIFLYQSQDFRCFEVERSAIVSYSMLQQKGNWIDCITVAQPHRARHAWLWAEHAKFIVTLRGSLRGYLVNKPLRGLVYRRMIPKAGRLSGKWTVDRKPKLRGQLWN